MDPTIQEVATFESLADIAKWVGLENGDAPGSRQSLKAFHAAMGNPRFVRHVVNIP